MSLLTFQCDSIGFLKTAFLTAAIGLHARTYVVPDSPPLSKPPLLSSHQSMPGLIIQNESNKPKCRPSHLITGFGILEESALRPKQRLAPLSTNHAALIAASVII